MFSGLPIADTTERIDIALTNNVPTFLETLKVILGEFQVESIILADEVKSASPELHREIIQLLADIPVTYVSHNEFKERADHTKACIRTGECTPYANIILNSASLF